jgi:hypothetical protein
MDPYIWIADTGATVHSTSIIKLAQDWRQETNNTVVVMGNGQKEEVMKTGKVTGIVKNCEGGIQGNITLLEVMFLPNGQYNLISITKVMQSGWKLEGDENKISLRKHNKILIFEIKIKTSRGVLFAVRIENGQELMTATVNNKFETKKVDINEAHALFGHLSIKMTQNISKTIRWELTGEADRCKHCAIARGRQMNFKKKTDHVALKKIGERLFWMLLL